MNQCKAFRLMFSVFFCALCAFVMYCASAIIVCCSCYAFLSYLMLATRDVAKALSTASPPSIFARMLHSTCSLFSRSCMYTWLSCASGVVHDTLLHFAPLHLLLQRVVFVLCFVMHPMLVSKGAAKALSFAGPSSLVAKLLHLTLS